MKSVLVTGATSLIGKRLLPRLVNDGWEVTALSRSVDHAPQAGLRWIEGTLAHRFPSSARPAPPTMIHTAYLPLLAPVFDEAVDAGIGRIIAFSSTSRFVKADSPVAAERQVAADLTDAEERLFALAAKRSVALTLFRPTIIYLPGEDRNLSLIARFVRRYRFFPMIGKGEGLRQPVHADDLATAAIDAVAAPTTFGKIYNLSGGETLSYRTMVERIFDRLALPPRIVTIPVGMARWGMGLASLLPGYRHLTGAMADRVEADLVFDHADATADFGYAPRRRFAYRD